MSGLSMKWEILRETPTFRLRRAGRFVVADLVVPHLVLSTSVQHGGEVRHVRHLLNHQSCEASGHFDRHRAMTEQGLAAYHGQACAEADLPSEHTAVMGTAANMNYTAVSTEGDGTLAVTAVVTAGVEGNATSAGEPATWRETEAGMERLSAYAGTINAMVLIDCPLTSGAIARAAITMTEGKTAALHRLAVPSRLSTDLATGTGTDQYCITAPKGGTPVLTSASPHMKLGELIGLTMRNATVEALRWQNGLEASYTRGLFHALGRYGVKEATFFDDIAPFVDSAGLDLLRRNIRAAMFEPMVGAAAHALAVVADRVRFGTLPESIASDALTQQAAMLAANLSTHLHRWPQFRTALAVHASGDVKTLVLAAVALGWSEKWRPA